MQGISMEPSEGQKVRGAKERQRAGTGKLTASKPSKKTLLTDDLIAVLDINAAVTVPARSG